MENHLAKEFADGPKASFMMFESPKRIAPFEANLGQFRRSSASWSAGSGEHSASGSDHASSTFQNRMRSVIEGPQVHSQVAVDRRLLRRFER